MAAFQPMLSRFFPVSVRWRQVGQVSASIFCPHLPLALAAKAWAMAISSLLVYRVSEAEASADDKLPYLLLLSCSFQSNSMLHFYIIKPLLCPNECNSEFRSDSKTKNLV